MKLSYNNKNAVGLVVVLLAASISLGFLNIIFLYALLALEIILVSLFFVSKLIGKITVLQFLWMISTLYIIFSSHTFNFYALFFLLNAMLGLMVMMCIDIDISYIVYKKFSYFAFFGTISAITILIELVSPKLITNIFRVLSPSKLSEIQIFMLQGRYLGITNYVWYTTLLLFIGGGYILSEYRSVPSNRRIKSIFAIILLVIASFISGSRSTMIVFPLVAVFFYGGKKNVKNFLIAFGALIILYYVVMNSNLSLRIVSKFSSLFSRIIAGDVIDTRRAELRELAISMFKANPFFGSGWYEFRNNAYETLGSYSHAHNLYFQLLAENGIIGTCIIILPWIVTYIKCFLFVYKYRYYKDNCTYKIAKCCLMLLTLIYIDSYVHVTVYDPRTMLLFYIICAITMQCTRVAPDSLSNSHSSSEQLGG